MYIRVYQEITFLGHYFMRELFTTQLFDQLALSLSNLYINYSSNIRIPFTLANHICS